jgi:hypothetical protein
MERELGRSKILQRKMQEVEMMPYILTSRLDKQAQNFFESMRNAYFPIERNQVPAHLMLFHQLPYEPDTLSYMETIRSEVFTAEVTRLFFLGNGVAYAVESAQLNALHTTIKKHFHHVLIPQDLQGYRPHITVQNKVSPQTARDTMAMLLMDFEPFTMDILGMDLWRYLGGKWDWKAFYPFDKL